MSDFIITLLSKEGMSERVTDAPHVHEELYKIGLEWKTADWAHGQEVVITVRPKPNGELDTEQIKEYLGETVTAGIDALQSAMAMMKNRKE